MLGNRERDLRNGFTIPPRFGLAGTFAAVDQAAMAAAHADRPCRASPSAITSGPGEPTEIGALASRMAGLLDPGLSWADVDWLRGLWKGPLLLKGVLHPAEAGEAADARARRRHRLEPWRAAARRRRRRVRCAARRSSQAVEGRIPVLIDGGIRRGSDVVKALALGARCCLIGRPQLWGLAVGGEAGVRHVLDIFRREIDRVMGLMGAPRSPTSGEHRPPGARERA